MTEEPRLRKCLKTIKDDLNRTVNFWLRHSHDNQFGGFFNCLSKDGKVYDTLKYGWLQARQVWTYAKLYNEIERFRTKEILEAAIEGGKFLMESLKDKQSARCFFLLTQDGKPVKTQRTLFCECFYLMAMSELSKATSESTFRAEAINMFHKIEHWTTVDDSELGRPLLEGCTPTSNLAIPMMVLCIAEQLLTMDDSIVSKVKALMDWAIKQLLMHVQRNGEVVLEHVSRNGKELAGSQGRLVNPGHVIECGWFLLKAAKRTDNTDLAQLALETFIMKPYNFGWDKSYKGLFYLLDIDGWPSTQLEWNMKLWWPHAEAMIAFLMAYQHTNNEKYLDKFEEVFDYIYSQFADDKDGEWYGYLNRDGTVSMDFKGGPFKGCFHVPRALLMCEQILEDILQNT